MARWRCMFTGCEKNISAQEARVTTVEEQNAFLTHLNASKCLATIVK